MRRLILAAVFALALAAPAAAAERPIVYVVVIDGLDGDRVDDGKAPFISSLLAEHATYYRESRSVMPAETNPNHTAMMTGAYPDTSGIAGNAFAIYAALENEDSCKATGPIDESKMPMETSGENANCPVAEMTFAAIKRQGNPDGLSSAGIFGKPKLGRIFAGKNVDPGRRDVDYLWAPCSSGADDDEYCENVPTNPASGYAMDDKTVMDRVIASMARKPRPSFTFVNLHQVDTAGHGTTPAGAYDTAIGQADDEIARMVGQLKSRGEWERTVLILLSDHSMDSTVSQRTSLQSEFGDAGIPDDSYLVVDNGSVDSVYLANRTSPDRFTLLKRMREAALATGRVDEALYREDNAADGGDANTAAKVHPAWHVAGARAPDLFVTHKPGGAFSDPDPSSNPLPGNHGGPQTVDNFFAVIGGGSFVKQQDVRGSVAPFFDDTLVNPGQVENVDPAATVMGLFGMGAPSGNAGRFLAEAFDLSALPGRGAPAPPRVGARRAGRRAYRIHAEGPGDSYGVQVRGCRGWKTLRKALKRGETFRFRARRGRGYIFRARATAASGVTGPYGPVKKVARRKRCRRS